MDTAGEMGIETVMTPRARCALLFAGMLLCSKEALASSLVTPVDCAPSGVKVHAGPSLNAPRLAKLPFGQRLRSLGRPQDGWYEVVLRNGRHGFSCGELLHEVPANDIEFTVRFMDVPGGEATIINVGDTDILIDGGSDPDSLLRYLHEGHLIRGPLELAIVTDQDSDHWNGFRCLRGLSGKLPFRILELWVPDQDNWCSPADAEELGVISSSLPGTCVLKHSVVVGNAKPPSNCKVREISYHPRNPTAVDVKLPFAPEVDLTILRPFESAENDCASRSNDSSLVFIATIGASRFLFTSDQRGKKEGDANRQEVQYGEKQLIEMANQEPGLLTANVLKVANHGADTSTMPGFISRVFPRDSTGPKFAVICSANHTKQDVVVKRCQRRAFVLSTDERLGAQKGDVVCIKRKGEKSLDCAHEPRLYRLPPIDVPHPSNKNPTMECAPCQAKTSGHQNR
ncbi:MAG TPA: SH3 domain-containing protein [Thermoanaerobaculia bacterium]|nr:SH3 domain-containing protein [Thermoanaerobaculia bacterium]